MENSKVLNFCDYYMVNIYGKIHHSSFDDELISNAEQNSSKWVRLYRNSSFDKNVTKISNILELSGLTCNEQATFDRSISSQTVKSDAIVEKENVVLLNKKYFKFETPDTSTHDVSSELSVYSTVFDQSDSVDSVIDNKEILIDSVIVHEPISQNISKKTITSPSNDKNKKTNKKKGRTKYRPFIDDNSEATSNEPVHSGAPPGVLASNRSKKIDLSKGGNASVRFRL